MRKYIILTIFLTVIFLIIGYITAGIILRILEEYLLEFISNSIIQAVSAKESFIRHITATLFFGLLPLLALIISYLSHKVRLTIVTLKRYFINLAIIFGGYLSGIFIKIFVLRYIFKTLDEPIIPQVINTFQLRYLKYHETALIVALIFAFFIIVLTKTNKLRAGY